MTNDSGCGIPHQVRGKLFFTSSSESDLKAVSKDDLPGLLGFLKSDQPFNTEDYERITHPGIKNENVYRIRWGTYRILIEPLKDNIKVIGISKHPLARYFDFERGAIKALQRVLKGAYTLNLNNTLAKHIVVDAYFEPLSIFRSPLLVEVKSSLSSKEDLLRAKTHLDNMLSFTDKRAIGLVVVDANSPYKNMSLGERLRIATYSIDHNEVSTDFVDLVD